MTANLSVLNEQIEPLKTAKEYLFESSEPVPTIVKGGKNCQPVGDALTEAMRAKGQVEINQ